MQYPLNYLKYTKNSKNTYTTATIKTTEIQIYITTKRWRRNYTHLNVE